MHGMERGGTSRDARVYNNIFYDCGEAAIVFPTRDNEADGNLYVRMQGGYLRVMYPEPEVCLHLVAWQEFLGFDKNGQNAWFDILFDPETRTVRMKPCEDRPAMATTKQMERLKLLFDPRQVQKVPAVKGVDCDWTGAPREEGPVLPGPFATFRIG